MRSGSKITPVILSGGSGTRLWPVSRTGRPKQLLPLTEARTMLQLTALRSADPSGYEAPIVVAGEVHAALISDQLAQVGCPPQSLILEPMARNTAPAIALAALRAAPDAVLLVMPSDHVIVDVEAFASAIASASECVADGWLVTFGIEPTGPETGYGYIRVGDPVTEGVHRVDRFVEKPDRSTAEAYLEEGRYSWNGGIFLFRADAFLDALERNAPDIAEAARRSMASASSDGPVLRPDAVEFASVRSESVDYAVMEKSDRVAVVPVSMGWSDVGSWDALHSLAVRDEAGNAVHGEVVAIDVRDCMIRAEGVLVAAVGVSDLIVVATRDAILIMPRGQSQEVKRAVEALKRVAHPSLDGAADIEG